MPPAPTKSERLAASYLCLLLTRRLCRLPPLAVLEAAIAGGCDLVQVREPEMPAGALADWVGEVLKTTSRSGVLLIVNDRPDVAMIAGADGVHLGQDDLRPASVRELCGDRLLIGLSTHSRAEIEAASALPVDYCGLGPVFDTMTKGLAGRGLGLVREALPCARKPTFVIGGITLENAPALRAAGVLRVAVSNAVCSAADPRAVAAAFARLFAASATA